MEQTLDVRGLACPIPFVRARSALTVADAPEVLVVLATDPEAPIDLAALAADTGRRFHAHREPDHWRLVLTGPARPRRTHAAGPDEGSVAT